MTTISEQIKVISALENDFLEAWVALEDRLEARKQLHAIEDAAMLLTKMSRDSAAIV